MDELKKFAHDIAIAATKLFAPLMPDRSPVTFVGEGAAADLCAGIAQNGVSKLLIVTDAQLVELGIVARITEDLAKHGVEWAMYDGVEPDPTFDHVHEGLRILRDAGCDGILAIGGGSPMDAAKVIAAMATNDKTIQKLEGLLKVKKPTLPLFAVPTTAGTGSEATVAAVVSDPRTHAKHFIIDPKLIPAMAALDPALMTGLPKPITAATGMDALTHAIESYISIAATDQTRRYAESAVRLIFDNLPTAYNNGNDMNARKGMALASYYAGMAFTRASVGYVHAIAHTFGAYYRTPHGLANAIVLPHVMEFSKAHSRAQLQQLANVLGLEGPDKADAFIEAVCELKEKVGIPATLDALERNDISKIAEQALAEAHMNYPVPRYMSQRECEGLIREMVAEVQVEQPIEQAAGAA